MEYGTAPQSLGSFELPAHPEMMAYLYLPIKMADSDEFRIEPRLMMFKDIVDAAIKNEDIEGKYVYLTAKHIWVEPGNAGNRMGWHCDGFLTDDVNIVWSDMNPTEFCVQPFEVTLDHGTSMKQFDEQADEDNIIAFPDKTLVRMDQYVVHRVSPNVKAGMRTFVKVSISSEKYNLRGNSHNYLFDYDWELFERSMVRNHPIHKEADFYNKN